MLEAFNMFCKQITTPEYVAKHLASTVPTTSTVQEVEKADTSSLKSQIISEA